MIKRILATVLALTRTEYGLYKIFQSDLSSLEKQLPPLPSGYCAVQVTGAEIRNVENEEMASQAGFDGRDALGFAVLRDEKIVSIAWVWHGARYREGRNFWPLGPDECKIVQTFTLPEERGKGLSPALMQYCNHELKSRGFKSVYSRIWWNHRSSIRVAEKAGRKHIATVLQVRFFGVKRPLRVVKRINRS